MLQHAPLPDYVPHTLGSNDCFRDIVSVIAEPEKILPTLIFPDILQSEGQAGVLPLDDPNLPKGAFPHDPQQSKMIEVHWRVLRRSVPIRCTERRSGGVWCAAGRERN
jgi:hypothetical protein